MWLMWIILALLLAAFIGLVVAMCRQYKGCPGCAKLRQDNGDNSSAVKKQPLAKRSPDRQDSDVHG